MSAAQPLAGATAAGEVVRSVARKGATVRADRSEPAAAFALCVAMTTVRMDPTTTTEPTRASFTIYFLCFAALKATQVRLAKRLLFGGARWACCRISAK